ncbi:hypothetical protein P7H09_00125 [Paenibacillus larvae]|uniref:Uncharacterized protein n=1 Tax=Paenibacillus larvae TaxID=1464 RepID=A0AAP5JPS9_9BACL|nr:hypothetical protein [Paenibacillus larvae]MDT2249844.1 hypothetical protein [Paenibacillus larvae]
MLKALLCSSGHRESGQRVLRCMHESSHIIIEANHDPDILEMSSYPNSVKARPLSADGPLSNDQTAQALKQLIKGIARAIYLTHLSNNNNLPALAEATVKRALAKRGLNEGQHYYLEVIAPRLLRRISEEKTYSEKEYHGGR